MSFRVMTYNILGGFLWQRQCKTPDGLTQSFTRTRLPESSSLSPISRNVIEAEIEYRPGQRFRLFGIHPIANLGVLFEVLRRWEARYIIQRAKPGATLRLGSADGSFYGQLILLGLSLS